MMYYKHHIKMHISCVSLILLLAAPEGYSEHACEAPYVCKSIQTCTAEQKNVVGKMRNRVLFSCARGKVCCPPLVAVHIQPTDLKIEQTTTEETKESAEANEFTTAATTPLQPLPTSNELLAHRNYKLVPQTCGLVLTNKIVDGEEAKVAEFPWMALIAFEASNSKGETVQQFVCGGTLITHRYVLTAAHCIYREGARLSLVRLGEFDLMNATDCNGRECYKPAIDIRVEKVIPHEDYSNKTFHNDIALLRLASNVSVYESSTVFPICLPWNTAPLNVKEGYEYEAAGWGLTGYREVTLSDTLRKVKLRGVSLDSCNSAVCSSFNSENPYCPIRPTQICVQGSRRKDVCKGDSGGPLMSTNHFSTIQLGVTSIKTTEVCGEANVPSIFTRVESYLPWILDNIVE